MAHWIDPPHSPEGTWSDLARDRARRLLDDPHAVIIDTETTDFAGWPVEIAVIDMTGAVLLDTLVHAPTPIAPGAQRVHGIIEDDLLGAPRLSDVLDALAGTLLGATVTAWNAVFDRDVLERAYTATRQAFPLWTEWECLMTLASWDRGQRNSRGQVRAVALETAGHRARADCLAALTALRELATTPTTAPPAALPG